MKHLARLAVALLAGIPSVLGTKFVPPSQDPWYSAPSGFEQAAPGTILRSRVAPANVTTLADNVGRAYQLLFRSRDTRYRPSWAVTTLLLPTKANQAKRDNRALLSLQLPYNTLDVDQSPSYGLSTLYGNDFGSYVQYGLSQGWAISVPDFEGPDAAYSAGPQAGQAVLDSLRAVLSFGKFSGPAAVRSALWGYSGGSWASDFAAELQQSYAPELNIAGVATGGVLSNWTQILYNVTSSPVAAIVPYSLLGITMQYPAARAYLVDHLHEEGPYNASTFLSALEIPTPDFIAAVTGQDIFKYFTNGDGILKAPEMARVLGNNWYEGYHGIPQMPMFAYKAIHDENTNIRTTDEHIGRICSVGANVLYQRNTIGNHTAEALAGAPKALDWLSKVLDGRPVTPRTGCRIENVTWTVPES